MLYSSKCLISLINSNTTKMKYNFNKQVNPKNTGLAHNIFAVSLPWYVSQAANAIRITSKIHAPINHLMQCCMLFWNILNYCIIFFIIFRLLFTLFKLKKFVTIYGIKYKPYLINANKQIDGQNKLNNCKNQVRQSKHKSRNVWAVAFSHAWGISKFL